MPSCLNGIARTLSGILRQLCLYPCKDLLDVILLSATPDLYFTSLTCTQEHRHGSNYPLMNAGKAILKEGKLVMPIAMTIHHGFIDGHHLSLFYKKVEEFLK